MNKILTDQEIETHQLFIEHCAKKYSTLGEKLIFLLANKLKVTINSEFPLQTFQPFLGNKHRKGIIENWNYCLHGFHCYFENKITQQVIEVPLVFGLEFGALDPYFFTQFLKSTPEFQPLPFEINDLYEDGKRINIKMLELGKFETINSNIENHYGVAVSEREKIKIKIFTPQKKKNSFSNFLQNLFK